MDINDILDSLGLDLTNPEIKRGAIEAIKAIMDSRIPPQNLSGAGGDSGNIQTDIDVDPDLIQPSQKYTQPDLGDDDIEIEDEEDLLSQVQHNESEDDLDTSGVDDGDFANTPKNAPESKESDEESDVTSDSTSNHPIDNDNTTDEVPTADQDTEVENDSDTSDEQSLTHDKEDDVSNQEENSNETNSSEEISSTDEIEGEPEENASEEDAEEEDASFDEEDILDTELADTIKDQALKAKQEARKIKRERTLAAAKKALADAKLKKVSPALILELEKSIEALESLTEAVQKNLNDLSDDEFNLMINRVFDAISAVGDSGLTFSTDEEREIQAQEIKTDIESRETQQELSDEDIAAIRAETQATKAREKEIAKYKPPARSSFKGFKDFLNSLYRAIALQVHVEEERNDTWAAISRRSHGDGVLQQGKRIEELPNKKIPIIDFYFDQSGSWSDDDISVGKKAVEQLAEMEANGQIKVNIYYFSDDVYTDSASARAHGSTSGWNSIVKNVIATNATNVIIMTDSDMEGWWIPQSQPPLRYTVQGYVWYLWRGGDNAPRLPKDLKGRGGVQQFSFNHSDI